MRAKGSLPRGPWSTKVLAGSRSLGQGRVAGVRLVLWAFLAVVLLTWEAGGGAQESGRPARRTPVVEIVERCSPAVVNISTEIEEGQPAYPFFRGPRDPLWEDFFNRFFAPQWESRIRRRSLGSGVLIDRKGHVLTNHHVVLKASKIHATLASGKEFLADLVGADPDSDLAVLRIALDTDVQPIPMGRSSDLMIGETVVAIGNPFGLSHSVTTGVVSALNRSIQVGEQTYKDFIQTDAAINPGNSGGPLLNIQGELVGINTAIYGEAQGIGFAIPVDRARRIVEDLLAYGEVQPVWFGLEFQPLTPELAAYLGFSGRASLLVSQVFPNSPAEKAGLKSRDILVRVGQTEGPTPEDFRQLLQQTRANDRVPFRVFRQGSYLESVLTAEVLPDAVIDALCLATLGIRLAEATGPGSRAGYGEGLVVDAVARGSQADRIGLGPGDLLIKLNDRVVRNLKEFRREYARLRFRSNVTIQILRGRYLYYVTLELGGFPS